MPSFSLQLAKIMSCLIQLLDFSEGFDGSSLQDFSNQTRPTTAGLPAYWSW